MSTDRAAVTSDLSPELLAELEGWAVELGLEPERWRQVASLRDFAITRAAATRAARYRATGDSQTTALELAADWYGRSPSFLRVAVHRPRTTATAAA